jgi:hypothetical protein
MVIDYSKELARMHKVSDMLVSCHSKLRDDLQNQALTVDLFILFFSVFLSAFTFSTQEVKNFLNPTAISSDILIGLISIALFFLSLIQMKVDWKERSAKHSAAVHAYFRIKSELTELLLEPTAILPEQYRHMKEQYSTIGEYNVKIPDDKFISLKRHHRLKVHLSRYLDKHPAAIPTFISIRLIFRDNFKKLELDNEKK